MDIEQLAGTTLGNYEVENLLGKGGMGVVYKARQISLNRPVALKILDPILSSDSSFVRRFQQEAEAIARLHHANIVQIYDIAEDQDLRFFSMEYVDGQTVADICAREGIIEIGEALRIVLQAGRALEHAHLNGIIHRDIKPSNIILDKENAVKVMDFGLARLLGQTRVTEASTIMGTADYMSPEQARGEPAIGHHTDIWSLGVVLYEMLTNRTPFVAANDSALLHKIIYEEPLDVISLNPEVPTGLAIVLSRAMAKDKDRRYESVTEFLKDILNFENLERRKRPPRGRYGKTVAMDAAEAVKERGAGFAGERMPFVGRKNEWTKILEALTQTAFGQGKLIMIGGEPGVGKTRLTEEIMVEAIQKGFLCLLGRCYEMQSGQPYMPFVEIVESAARTIDPEALLQAFGEAAPEVAKMAPEIRRKFPHIPEPIELPPEQEQRYTFNSIAEFIERAAKVQPLLLVLEDLHWAGESTMLLIQHIARQIESMPVLIIGTYRDTELAVSRPLARVMEDLLRQHMALDIVLGRLAEAEVAKMLKDWSNQTPPKSLVKLLFNQTDGNPFFIGEIVKHLAHQEKLFDREGHWRTDLNIEEVDVPRGVRLVVGHRLQRLSKPCLETLTAAATIGRVVESDLLEKMVELSEGTFLDSVEEAEHAGLIRSTSKANELKIAFSHEYIRKTLLSDISGLRRQRLHFQIAETMEKVYEGNLDEHAAELAYHLKRSGASADMQKTQCVSNGRLSRGCRLLHGGAFH
jgi:tRNA A-37 threonylcarbamoyl transferase component Bud32